MVLTIKNYNFFDKCPECYGTTMQSLERGEVVCNSCGLIIEDRKMDTHTSGKRAYSMEDINEKIQNGLPISDLIPDISLCTLIDKNKIHNPELKRAAERDNHLSWKYRNLLMATTELKRISHNLGLPGHIRGDTLKLYKKTFEKNLLRGRSILGMLAACIYYTCKDLGVPRPFNEILNSSSASKERIMMCYKTLVKELNLKTTAIDPILLIPKYIAELGLSPDLEKLVIKFIQSFQKSNSMTGVNPKGICAGGIYLACKLKNIKINQRFIANTIGITEVTLRSRYREILDLLKFF